MYFDNGYSFMEHFAAKGYKSLPQYGDWPYDCVMYKVNDDHTRTVARYTEGDIFQHTYDTLAFQAYLANLEEVATA